MQLDIRWLNLPASHALEQFARERVLRSMRPFVANVDRVDVRLQDLNGPRGGVDQQCTVTVTLVGTKRSIVVKSTSDDAYGAVQRACARAAESVARALARQRQLDRFLSPVRRVTPPQAHGPEPQELDVRSRPARSQAIRVTVEDHERLRNLIDVWSDTRDRDAAEALSNELDRAEIVPRDRIGRDVVTMGARVVFADEETGERREVALVYPHESAPGLDRISVLAPIGSALLGLSTGQTIEWPLPGGRRKRLRIVRVIATPLHEPVRRAPEHPRP